MIRNFLDVKSPWQKAILRRTISRKGETTEISHYCPLTVLIFLPGKFMLNIPRTHTRTRARAHTHTHTHTHTHLTPEYLRNNRSYKRSNLLTKFFPAGSDRSHFLLRILSEVLNGNSLAWFTCLDVKRQGFS